MIKLRSLSVEPRETNPYQLYIKTECSAG
jgi:hypothetical protein